MLTRSCIQTRLVLPVPSTLQTGKCTIVVTVIMIKGFHCQLWHPGPSLLCLSDCVSLQVSALLSALLHTGYDSYMTALTRLHCSYTEGRFSCKSQTQSVHVQAKVSRQITCEESWLRLLAWELTPIMQHLHHSKLHSSKPSDCLLLCPRVCLSACA